MNHLVNRVVLAGATIFLASGGDQSLSATKLAPSHATGSAQVVLSDRVDPVCGSSCSQRMTMNAVSTGDGNAVGQFTVFSEEGGGIRVHGSITCLSVEGNEAQLGGIITQATIPDLIGLRVTWRAVDNGEGTQFPADQTSDLFGNRDCGDDITSHPRFELFDVIDGNIDVSG
jgi:hypothetical protein